MGTRFDLDACAQTRGGKLWSGEVLSALIAETKTFDDAINVATVRDFKRSSLRLAPVHAAAQAQTVGTRESKNE